MERVQMYFVLFIYYCVDLALEIRVSQTFANPS